MQCTTIIIIINRLISFWFKQPCWKTVSGKTCFCVSDGQIIVHRRTEEILLKLLELGSELSSTLLKPRQPYQFHRRNVVTKHYCKCTGYPINRFFFLWWHGHILERQKAQILCKNKSIYIYIHIDKKAPGMKLGG